MVTKYRFTVTDHRIVIPALTEMGSDWSHLNVSLIVRDKVTTTETVSTNHNPFEEKESRSRFEPRSFCLPA